MNNAQKLQIFLYQTANVLNSTIQTVCFVTQRSRRADQPRLMGLDLVHPMYATASVPTAGSACVELSRAHRPPPGRRASQRLVNGRLPHAS
jgi:hypothetical protein